jgi:hypothetical protein
MGHFLSKKDEVLEKIRESSNDKNLSENEFLKNFTDYYRRFIPSYQINSYNIFSKYIMDSTKDYRFKNYLLGLLSLNLEKKNKLNIVDIYNLEMKIKKLNLLLEIKKNEINKLKFKTNKYDYKNKLKRKEIRNIENKMKGRPRKLRRINRNFNKLVDDLSKKYSSPDEINYFYDKIKNNK